MPSPFDCWLIMRGIRTLPLRVQRADAPTRMRSRSFSPSIPKVEAVHYPGLDVASRRTTSRRDRCRGFGGMLSVQAGANRERVDGDRRAGSSCSPRRRASAAPRASIEHRASVEGPGTRAPENLLRVSVGLEHIDDLKEDFDAALRG